MKKFLSFVLSLCIFAMMWNMPVSAASTEKTTINYASLLEEDDLHMNEDVAYYIAEFFVRDMTETGYTTWDNETTVQNVVPMYDETGETVTAYTAELNKGYVVVSAYIDMPNIILEWSDETEPVYSDFPSDEGKIVYTGTLAYYLDSGKETLQTVDGINVPRKDIFSSVSNLRNIANVPDTVLKNIIDAQNSSSIEPYAYGDENDKDGYISNVITYAKNVYNGTWKAYDYENNWESYANYAVTSSFSNEYKKCCGPVAITNAIKMYGNQYNKPSIKSSTNRSIFTKVIQANADAGKKYYVNSDDPNGGTPFLTVDAFIWDSFNKCGYGKNVSTYGPYFCNVQDIKNATTSDRLMYIYLYNYKAYGDHAVIGFAWNCVQNQLNGELKYFVKVADGISSGGRYLDQTNLKYDRYWEIKF